MVEGYRDKSRSTEMLASEFGSCRAPGLGLGDGKARDLMFDCFPTSYSGQAGVAGSLSSITLHLLAYRASIHDRHRAVFPAVPF